MDGMDRRNMRVVEDELKRNERFLLSYLMSSESDPKNVKFAGIADEVLACVEPEDFYRSEHSDLFTVIKMLHDRRRSDDEGIDFPKVVQALRQYCVDKQRSYRKAVTDDDICKISADVSQLITACSSDTFNYLPVDWRALMQNVIDAGQARAAFYEFADNAREIQLGDKKKLREVSDKIASILNRQTSAAADPADPVQDMVSTVDKLIANIQKTDEERAADSFTTRFHELDRVVEFNRKAFWVIGARASAGKTSLACDLARSFAKQKHHVSYFTMEMSRDMINQRMLCAESGLPQEIIMKSRPARDLTSDEYAELYNAADRLTANKTLRVYEHALDIDAIENQCRILASKGILDIVVVDFLQRLSDVQQSNGNRYSVMCDITMRLKNMAMRYNCLVIGLSQFNRAQDNLDENGYPTMSCFRDSGSIEQDADGLIAIHRPPTSREIVEQNDDCDPCLLFILKNRNGAVGRIHFDFDTQHFRFSCADGTFDNSDLPSDGGEREEVEDGGMEQGELLQDYEAGNAAFADAVRRAGEESARTGEAVPLVVDDAPAQPKKRRGRPPKNAAAKRDEPKKKKSFDELPKRVQAEIKEKQFQQACDDLASETKG